MKRTQFLKIMAIGVPVISSSIGRVFAQNQLPRSVRKVYTAANTRVSAELSVRRSLPITGLKYADPFVMLDHFGPVEMKPGEGAFVPPHPHRGFEPVTFLFEGQAEHKDSLGNHAVLNAGDVQWMTSGRGIVHQEDMGKNFKSDTTRLNGIQLWVNLPKKDKFTQPKYQEISAKQMPTFKEDRGNVRVQVVAGDIFGTKGPASTFSPINAFMIQIKPGGKLDVPVPKHWTAFTHILEGSIDLDNGKTAKEGQLALFENNGEFIPLRGTAGHETKLIFLAGEPLNEPVFSYGPFVMNTRQEINQAYMDYKAGKMGRID
jgi:redox-sensitive bicupin YhaK (pirin superfamily)